MKGRGGAVSSARGGGCARPRAHIQTAFTPMSIPMCLPPYRLGVAQIPQRDDAFLTPDEGVQPHLPRPSPCLPGMLTRVSSSKLARGQVAG